MKVKFVFLMFFIIYIITIILFYYIYLNKDILINDNNIEYKINELDDIYKYKIKVYYPKTKYRVLDSEIKKVIYNYIMEFKEIIDDEINRNNYFYLDINYDEYQYKNYISYVFYIESYLGGAHPDHAIVTVNYNITSNEIIDIEDLIKLDIDFLNKISRLSRTKLLSDKKFSSNDYVEDFFLEGTMPRIDNYKRFVFTNSGIKILFNYYQIAPYYYGDSEIIIPYKDIPLDIEKIT